MSTLTMGDEVALDIGLVTSPGTADCLRAAYSSARWHSYADLPECARRADEDELDLVIVELRRVRTAKSAWRRVRRESDGPASTHPLAALADRCPVVVLTPAGGSPRSGDVSPGLGELEGPVDADKLRKVFAEHAERIRRRRLERMFRRVADVYAAKHESLGREKRHASGERVELVTGDVP